MSMRGGRYLARTDSVAAGGRGRGTDMNALLLPADGASVTPSPALSAPAGNHRSVVVVSRARASTRAAWTEPTRWSNTFTGDTAWIDVEVAIKYRQIPAHATKHRQHTRAVRTRIKKKYAP